MNYLNLNISARDLNMVCFWSRRLWQSVMMSSVKQYIFNKTKWLCHESRNGSTYRI